MILEEGGGKRRFFSGRRKYINVIKLNQSGRAFVRQKLLMKPPAFARSRRGAARNSLSLYACTTPAIFVNGVRVSPKNYDFVVPVTVAAAESLKSVTLGNVTMSHRTREAMNAASLSHSTMIGLPARSALEELVHSLQMYCKLLFFDVVLHGYSLNSRSRPHAAADTTNAKSCFRLTTSRCGATSRVANGSEANSKTPRSQCATCAKDVLLNVTVWRHLHDVFVTTGVFARRVAKLTSTNRSPASSLGQKIQQAPHSAPPEVVVEVRVRCFPRPSVPAALPSGAEGLADICSGAARSRHVLNKEFAIIMTGVIITLFISF
ncbi:hypothetical protein EVAR_17098_1 [Eumeta japonica]|uniref:Uncharacterized protein n=1 Tax=Eumeta variegata TaxID=151549 RepID=A0A4C1ULS9_EUMVA|nr:hypothetical protein EVAR_17098_1 [Eumeta japonica]